MIQPQGLSLDSIQAMRAIAALSVVFAHIPFMGVGVFGVDIFFVISGFIVAYITSGGAESFLRNRIARIVPLYWAGTISVFCLALVMPGLLNSTTADGVNLVKSLFFVPYTKENGTVMPMLFLGWTLNYEMFFYALYALMLRISRKHACIAAIGAILLLVLAGKLFLPGNVVMKFYSAPVLLEFAYGLAIYLLWRNCSLCFARIPVAAAMIGILGVLGAMWIVESTTPITTDNRWMSLGLLAAAFFALTLSLQGKVRMPMALVLVGDASYSLYLFHPYVIQFMDRKVFAIGTFSPMAAGAATIAVALCIFLALMCYRYFERPSNQWLRQRLR
jgi:exopolysaccharide production protein ExoZ